jgi:hypothetical protein
MFGDLFSQHADYQKGILYQGRRRFLVPKGKNALEPPVEFKTRRQSVRSIQNAKSHAEKHQPMQGLDLAPQHLASVIMNTKNSFLNLRNNGDFKSKRNIKGGALKPLVIQHYSSVDSKDWDEEYQAGCHLYVNKNTGEVSVECPWRGNIHTTIKSKKIQIQQTMSSDPMDSNGANFSSPSDMNRKLAPLTPSGKTPLAPIFQTPNKLPALGSPGTGTPAGAAIFGSGGSIVSLGSLGISSGRYQVYDEEENLGTGSLVYDRSELDDMLTLLDSNQKGKRNEASP